MKSVERCVLQKYKEEGHDTIILAGAEYGSGSSRDWAAKGPFLQVKPISSTYFVSLACDGPLFVIKALEHIKSWSLYFSFCRCPHRVVHSPLSRKTRILTVPYLCPP
jgi:hypothetical protein